mgnify:CR=1 FL=1
MKKKISINNSSNIKINKKTGNTNLNGKNSNSLRYHFFNKVKNRNKISIIINFLDINEQLPLLKLNSIVSKIIINEYNRAFKSLKLLKKYKIIQTSNRIYFTEIYWEFKSIIKTTEINEKDYLFALSF